MAIKVLFICSGNICRSPSAEGALLRLIEKESLEEYIEVDSAGTHGYHAGEPPDPRTCEVAMRRGLDLSDLRARKIEPGDFDEYDYILAMTEEHHHFLMRNCPSELQDRVHMFLSFAKDVQEVEVPDPYYGGPEGFEHVLDLVEVGCQGLLDHLIETHIQMMR